MDTSADVMVLPQPTSASEEDGAVATEAEVGAEAEAELGSPPSAASLEEFSSRLSDIISASVSVQKAEPEPALGAKGDPAVAMETETSQIRESLDQFPSPVDKLEQLIQRHAQLVVLQSSEQQQLLLLRAELLRGASVRSQLEVLCRDVQTHCRRLWEETVQRCREDEERRAEMARSFQAQVVEIQAQIQQQSNRNQRLRSENASLSDKLGSLLDQCQARDQGMEKIQQHQELQLQLVQAQLEEAQAKHQREKEYLLREAIEKTKKCVTMKEQELALKKKAADWKLQAQTLTQQAALTQAQLTLYGQKFEEFQETLAKSNQIYARFKQEMEKMTEKMKMMEKDTNLWKSRFENCNKALNDMMEERTEKGKELQLFVLKIHKLEQLCRALQEERGVLYDKIKEVRRASSSSQPPLPSSSGSIQELPEEEDPVLTEEMSRLREEQAKLQEFAAALFATPLDHEKEEEEEGEGGGEGEARLDVEEDEVSSAFIQFKTRTPTAAESDSVPEQAESPPEEVKGQSRDHEAEAQDPPVEPEPPADVEPEASTRTSDPVHVLDEEDERQEEDAAVASPSDTSKKQMSKKKKKKNTKSAT